MKPPFERSINALSLSFGILAVCLVCVVAVPGQDKKQPDGKISNVPVTNVELRPPIAIDPEQPLFPWANGGLAQSMPFATSALVADPAAVYANLSQASYSGVVFAHTQVGGVTRLVADDLTLAGTPPHNIGSFFWVVCYTGSGTVTVRSLVRFYADNAGVPGNLIRGYNFNAFIPLTGPICQPIVVRLPPDFQMTLTDNKIWAGITFDNADGATATVAQMDNIGGAFYNPPEIGSSGDQFFRTTDPGDFLVNNPVGTVMNVAGGPLDNFGWELRRRVKLNPIARMDPDPREPGTTARWSVSLNTSDPADATQLTGLTPAHFSLVTTGSATGTINSITPNGGGNNSWTVTATLGAGTGTVGLNLTDNQTNLSTGIANAFPIVGEVYNVAVPLGPVGPPAILFVSNRDGNNEIYRMNADGTDQRRLTNSAESEPLAKWSPTGEKIAFLRVLSQTNSQIWTMNPDGTGQTMISDADGINRLWGWSPDGKKILYAKKGAGNSFPLWTMNPDGGGKLQITTPGDLEDHNARYSPSGKRIVFARCVMPAAVCDVWAADADGSNAANLTADNTGDDDVPKFTRDGRIVFARSDDQITYNTWVMNSDGSDPLPVTNVSAGQVITGEVSPTGSSVLLQFRGATAETYEIYRASLAVDNVVNITNNSVLDANGFWSPDGEKIAFQSRRDAAADEIYTMRSDGSGVLRLTNNTAGDFLTDWYRHPKLSTPFDFDGDGKADVSVFREGTWWVKNSNGGHSSTPWGQEGDEIAAADYDGDGTADRAIFREGTWWLMFSSGGTTAISWGLAGDVPVAADYDGDGRADLAVFRDGTWWILPSDGSAHLVIAWGTAGDRPVPGDYDGDGKTDLAIFRNGTWWIRFSGGGHTAVGWGLVGDIPTPADFDGDGRTDLAVFRGGTWWILNSRGGHSTVSWGLAADKPVPADYDGDGRADAAVVRNGTWWIRRSADSGHTATPWGFATDKPVPEAVQ